MPGEVTLEVKIDFQTRVRAERPTGRYHDSERAELHLVEAELAAATGRARTPTVS